MQRGDTIFMAKNDYSRERSWILKKLNSGDTTQNELLNCVGAFSNKKTDYFIKIYKRVPI